MRANVDDLLHKGLAVGAGNRQGTEPVEIYIIIQSGHTGLNLIVLHTNDQILSLHIAGIAQCAHAHADDALHRVRDFHFPAIAVHNHSGFRRGCRSSLRSSLSGERCGGALVGGNGGLRGGFLPGAGTKANG